VLAFKLLATMNGCRRRPRTRATDRRPGRRKRHRRHGGGQALDLAAEGRKLSLAEIEQVHALKTGALIRASVLMAAHCSTSLDATGLQALGEFGNLLGLAFQIQDDILDIEGDAALIGKPVGSDEARDMPTYPRWPGYRQRMRGCGNCTQPRPHGWPAMAGTAGRWPRWRTGC